MPHFRNDKALAPFKELILDTCGFVLELGREQTLLAALRARMTARRMRDPKEYYALLLRDRGELSALVELLTVNETYFFREPDHLQLAVEQLLPELLAARGGPPLSIVSAGCSTGEEPYSIAIMLAERYGLTESGRLFAITGVDIDSGAIAGARRGVYGRPSFRGTDPGLMERHFEPAGAYEYRVQEGVRRLVQFAVANLMGPAFPPGMQHPDLIFYRNVSIYFPAEVQQKIFATLAGLLNEGGYLMVGASETIHHNTGILSLVQRGPLFLYRKEARAQNVPHRRTAEGDGREPKRSIVHHPLRKGVASPARAPRDEQRGAQQAPRPEGEQGYRAACALLREGQPEPALALLEALDAKELGMRERTLKASLLLDAARYPEAAALCAALVAEDPLSLPGCLMLGLIARHQGDSDEAFRRFRQAVYLDAGCWPAHFYLAEILFGRGDGRKAKGGYETTLRLLEQGGLAAGEALAHLPFNAEQFAAICRHKLSLLKENV